MKNSLFKIITVFLVLCVLAISKLFFPLRVFAAAPPTNFQNEFSARGEESGVCHTTGKYGLSMYLSWDPKPYLQYFFYVLRDSDTKHPNATSNFLQDLFTTEDYKIRMQSVYMGPLNPINKNIDILPDEKGGSPSKAIVYNLQENIKYTPYFSIDTTPFRLFFNDPSVPIQTPPFTCVQVSPVKNIKSTDCFVDEKGKPIAYLEWDQSVGASSYDVEVYDQNGIKLDSTLVYKEEKDKKPVYKAKVLNLSYGINYRPWVRAKNDEANKMSEWEKGNDFSCKESDKKSQSEKTNNTDNDTFSGCQALDKSCVGPGLKKITYASQNCSPTTIPDVTCADMPISCDLALPDELKPNNETLSIAQTEEQAEINLTWNAVAYADSYDIRVIDSDRLTTPSLSPSAKSSQPSNCPAESSTTDICINTYKNTNLTITAQRGKKYNWWIHANKEGCTHTEPAVAFFQIGKTAPTTASCDDKKVTLSASATPLIPGTRASFSVSSTDNAEGLLETREEFSAENLQQDSCTGQTKDKTYTCTINKNASGILTWKHFWNCINDSCANGCMKSQDFVIKAVATPTPIPTCVPNKNPTPTASTNTTQLKQYTPPEMNPCQ